MVYGNLDLFIKYLIKSSKKVNLFYDIETFTVNRNTKKPSELKTFTYSLAFAFKVNNKMDYVVFNNFLDFYETCKPFLRKTKKYYLIAHNSRKYDNHFIRYELKNYLFCDFTNEYKKNCFDAENTLSINDLKIEEKNKGIFLESRVKSSNSLDFKGYLDGFYFETIDNFVKTNISIANIGKKLYDKGIIPDDYLKTSYDYLKYDLEYDLKQNEILKYSLNIFNNLTQEELIYIRNDVYILCECFYNYKKLFFGFDYDKPTFTSNIKTIYEVNDLSTFQLFKKIGKETVFEYGDYTFHNLNCFDYFNNFYNGGLNVYNDKYVGKTLKNGFSIDINSSYPSVMYSKKFPLYITSFNENCNIKLEFNDDYITFFTLTIEEMNSILDKIPSTLFKKILVKYYHIKDNEIYLNSIVIKLLNELFNLNISKLNVTSYVTFFCVDFGARNVIDENYRIKTLSKSSIKLNYIDALNINETSEINTHIFNSDEILQCKVLLNGIYGLPALRLYFDLFRVNEKDEIYNIKSGFRNTERNIIFSATVTAHAFYNLLYPLKKISDKIDTYLWYADTDSLYLDIKAKKLLDSNIYNSYIIGKWDIENEHIDDFYILNHKKYCYSVNGKIKIRTGGVRKSSFNTNMNFNEFVRTQFSDGVTLSNQKSIMNKDKTISIYSSDTVLKKGYEYPLYHIKELYYLRMKEIENIKNNYLDFDEFNELLYIESELGTISARDFIPKLNKTNENMLDLYYINKNVLKMIERG